MFFLRAMQQQKRRLAVKVDRERVARTALSVLSVEIMAYAHDHGRVTTRDMVRAVGASSNTLKATFRKLVDAGLLVRHGGGRSIWYSQR